MTDSLLDYLLSNPFLDNDFYESKNYYHLLNKPYFSAADIRTDWTPPTGYPIIDLPTQEIRYIQTEKPLQVPTFSRPNVEPINF